MTGVFCAIDTIDKDRAITLAMELAETGCGVKLGLEFFTAHGPSGIADVRSAARETTIFLDLKLHDIPNTVAGAVRAAVHCQAAYLTLHASGGLEMMKAALKAAREEEDKTGYPAPKLLGVTVLTSLDAATLESVGQGSAPDQQVPRLARLAKEAGLHGVVCSPREIGLVRQAAPGLALVVPGIRPAGADAGDQKRVMTPQEAAAAGADWLVIGRPITEAHNPAQAARDILASLKKAA
jgi:orotidine-5'-phosphate decarboxylase